jgi:hypothetical protein
MFVKIDEPHNDRPGFSRWLFWLLAIPTLLASFAALIGPWVLRNQEEDSNRRSLTEEVRRLGGRADVPEGGFDFMSGTALIHADLERSTITDEIFASLSRMPAFRRITIMSLADTRITDKGLKSLEGNAALVALDLSRTGITDAGFESLSTIRWLNNLNMSGTKVTDAGLEILRERCSPTSRMMLDVTDTAVTEDGARKLMEAFKNWNIIYGSHKKPKL